MHSLSAWHRTLARTGTVGEIYRVSMSNHGIHRIKPPDTRLRAGVHFLYMCILFFSSLSCKVKKNHCILYVNRCVMSTLGARNLARGNKLNRRAKDKQVELKIGHMFHSISLSYECEPQSVFWKVSGSRPRENDNRVCHRISCALCVL